MRKWVMVSGMLDPELIGPSVSSHTHNPVPPLPPASPKFNPMGVPGTLRGIAVNVLRLKIEMRRAHSFIRPGWLPAWIWNPPCSPPCATVALPDRGRCAETGFVACLV